MSLTSTSRVVVIGGTSGIGLAVAQAAADAGAYVVVGSRKAESVQQALSALPERATGRAVDVSEPHSLAAFFEQVGPIDHLVYTAGDDLVRGPITEYDPRQASAFFDVRLFRALDAVRLALPTLSSAGSVTLTSGAAAFRGGAGRLLGAAVSGAVNSAAQSLAVELAPIRVNVVAPGIVRTPLWNGIPEAVFEQLGAGTLVGRVADPQDIAQVYLGLMAQNFTTGTIAIADGGGILKD